MEHQSGSGRRTPIRKPRTPDTSKGNPGQGTPRSSRETHSQADRSSIPASDADKKSRTSLSVDSTRSEPTSIRRPSGRKKKTSLPRESRKGSLFFTEYFSGLSPAPSPVKLTVTPSKEEKQQKLSLFHRATKPSLDSQGLQELLTNLHTPASASVSTRSKGGIFSGAALQDQVQDRARLRLVASLCGGFATVTLVLVIMGWLNKGPNEGRKLPCDSQQCRYYDQFLDHVTNASIDPCHDFHAHICSRWTSRNELPIKETVLDEFLQRVASRAFKTTVPLKGQSAIQKGAQFFQSCNAVEIGKVSELNALKSILFKCGVHWPELSSKARLLDNIFCLTALWNWSPVVKFVMDRTGFLTIRPEESYGETLLRRRHMLGQRSGEQSQYEEYFHLMVEAFKNDKKPAKYEQLLKLESVIVPRLYRSFVLSNSTSLYNQSIQQAIAASRDVIPLHIWDNGLRKHLNTSVNSALIVLFENVEFFSAFFHLVGIMGEAQMAYYHGWALIQVASLLAGQELARLYVLRSSNRWRAQALFCAWSSHHYMGLAFYAAYMREAINRDMATEISELVSFVQQAAQEKLARSPWPSAASTVEIANPPGSTNALHKLLRETDPAKLDLTYQLFPNMTSSITTNIELATQGRRLTEASTRMPPMIFNRTVRYIHVDDAGRLVLFPVMFELPFFPDGTAFQAVKYGALGGEVADTLSSLLFQRIQELSKNFLTMAYNMPCLVKAYQGAHRQPADAEKLFFLRKASSIRFLYEAFARTNPSSKPLRLRNHEYLTEIQIFFIFWCVIQCGMDGASTACNQVLGGFDRFAAAFKCTEKPASSNELCDILSISM